MAAPPAVLGATRRPQRCPKGAEEMSGLVGMDGEEGLGIEGEELKAGDSHDYSDYKLCRLLEESRKLLICLFLLSIACVVWISWPFAMRTEEHAAVESPRTQWSARTAKELETWFQFHDLLAQEAATHRPAQHEQGRLVLIGDSITESWRGTSYGKPIPRAKGVPEVLQVTLAARWPDPLVLAIAGDQTQHVLWRLSHGELSEQMKLDGRLLFVLLIGTNNLGRGHLPEESHGGIIAVARRLLIQTRGKLLVQSLLPRGDGKIILQRMCPPRCNKKGRPFQSFLPAINKVNLQLRESILSLEKEFHGRVGLVNCGDRFLSNGTEEVELNLMPDRLHPNVQGHRILASCIKEALVQLQTSPGP